MVTRIDWRNINAFNAFATFDVDNAMAKDDIDAQFSDFIDQVAIGRAARINDSHHFTTGLMPINRRFIRIIIGGH